jgi:hypothetical protein
VFILPFYGRTLSPNPPTDRSPFLSIPSGAGGRLALPPHPITSHYQPSPTTSSKRSSSHAPPFIRRHPPSSATPAAEEFLVCTTETHKAIKSYEKYKESEIRREPERPPNQYRYDLLHLNLYAHNQELNNPIHIKIFIKNHIVFFYQTTIIHTSTSYQSTF